MEKKTKEMIKFLKKNYNSYDSLREAAIAYMSDYSGVDKDFYTDDVIERNIFEIFCDFIDSVDKPSTYIREMRKADIIHALFGRTFNAYDLMLDSMFMVQVMDNGKYINGFKKEDWEED